MKSGNDLDLIERLQRGDRGAFEELVQKYQDRIYSLCRYTLKDAQDAQDAAQDVFIKAYKKLADFRPDTSFLYAWLYRIAVNTCLDYNKRSYPKPLEDDTFVENVASPDPSPEHLYQSKETGRFIHAALTKIPEKLRAAIVLKEIEALSYQEIAEILDTSIGTVKSRISRAREELRYQLRDRAQYEVYWNKSESQSFYSMEGHKMKCSRIRKMISPYLDDELNPDERRLFTAHVQECGACKKELEDIRSVHNLFATTGHYTAPLGFATRVMANLEEPEETAYSRLWRFFSGRLLFLRTVEVAFAVAVMLLGMISGNVLVSDRIPTGQTSVGEIFSLGLFQAAPPDSIEGVYIKLVEVTDEK
jgi:RNA polymerase sigma-70 factor (ECF subfamily)